MKVTIISDSIAKQKMQLEYLELHCQYLLEKNIAQIANKIQFGSATLEPFDYVIVHLGTNDLDNRASYDDIISDFGNLIGICQDKKPSIQIIVSAILLRPVDFKIIDNVRRRVNDYLQKSMSKFMRFKFVCSYKPFMRAGQERRDLFA